MGQIDNMYETVHIGKISNLTPEESSIELSPAEQESYRNAYRSSANKRRLYDPIEQDAHNVEQELDEWFEQATEASMLAEQDLADRFHMGEVNDAEYQQYLQIRESQETAWLEQRYEQEEKSIEFEMLPLGLA